MTSTVLLTGANRGIGLAMARGLSERGHRVIATARRPADASDLAELAAHRSEAGGRVEVAELDVASDESVAALAHQLEGTALDTLINNAGIGGDRRGLFEQDLANHSKCFEVNSLGPLRTTLALIEHLRAGHKRQVVNITSQLGSMTLNTSGGYLPYRSSKAALNMITRSLAAELGNEGFTCTMIHPGWVRTEMGGSQAPLSTAESVAGILEVLAALTPRDNGRFVDYSGAEMPW